MRDRDHRRAYRRRNRRRRAVVGTASVLALGVGIAIAPAVIPSRIGSLEGVRATTLADAVLSADRAPAADDRGTAAVAVAVAGTTVTSTTDDIDDQDEPPGVVTRERDPLADLLAPATPESSDAAGSEGQPWSDEVDGVLTFRGNPTRTYHGRGPVPSDPVVEWAYPGPDGQLCGPTSLGGATQIWCGAGWTGQPAIWEEGDRTWLALGAFDHAVHVLDADTGEQRYEPFATGDIIKGSVTVDPDGYPLLYTGSRDNSFRVLALDRDEIVELWRLDADDVSPTLWNNDWDASALIIDDHLLEGGENSQFHIVRLNRSYDADGLVTTDPELVFNTPGWDDQLLADHGTTNVSIENSVAVHGGVAYFANSGGLVQGWDISGLVEGETPTRVFRFWAGDDVDATIVIDEDGMLYVGAEFERGSARSREIGQLLKLDPSRPDDPLVWSVPFRDAIPDGIWATPALHRDVVYVATHQGLLVAVDRQNGDVRWSKQLNGKTWQSPVVVDDVLIQGDCAGNLRAFDVSDTSIEPAELWSLNLDGGCIESTPVVWDGRIYVATRAGRLYALGQR